MTSENNSAENDRAQNETQASQVQASADGGQNPEPIKTYENINASVSQATIQERLAKKRAESAPAAESAGENGARPRPLQGKLQTRRERPAGENDGERRGGRGRRPRGEEAPKKEPAVQRSAYVPLPNLRQKSEDEEAELARLFADNPMANVMSEAGAVAAQEIYEETTKVKCRIVAIQKDSVFVNVGARDQGVIPLKQFPEDEPPKVGAEFDAVINRYNKDDGLYEVSLPLAAAEVGDWSSLTKGLIVNAKITGANKGGLECEVGHIRAFMPLGQIQKFRIADPETLIGETMTCIITEVNPARRNLVVSHRALVEQEEAEQRDQLLAELEVGQTRSGTVRKLIDAGAFVSLGGADGFIPVSQIGWGRIKHPSDVLHEGDIVSVKVIQIKDADTNRPRITLSYKDSAADPWLNIGDKFAEGTQVCGQITRIAPFGAFVEIAPGLEGLVHVSEIAYQRVENPADALNEGEFVDVKILSIDTDKKKISLSIKQLSEDPRKAQREAERAARQAAMTEEELKAEADRKAKDAAEEAKWNEKIEKSKKGLPKEEDLKGGVTSRSEGSKFGLKW